jgi:hypothetical protein
MTKKMWSIQPTDKDEVLVNAELQRMQSQMPSVSFTRADAMRSMWVRASAQSTPFGAANIGSNNKETVNA